MDLLIGMLCFINNNNNNNNDDDDNDENIIILDHSPNNNNNGVCMSVYDKQWWIYRMGIWDDACCCCCCCFEWWIHSLYFFPYPSFPQDICMYLSSCVCVYPEFFSVSFFLFRLSVCGTLFSTVFFFLIVIWILYTVNR